MSKSFLFTDDFKRLLVGLVQGDTLMTLRLATKAWNRVVDAFIDEGVRSGTLIIHGGNDFGWYVAHAQKERRGLVTWVNFRLNITKVGCGERCYTNLVVVDIPEGVVSIGEGAFDSCCSLTTVSFPTTLNPIGVAAFLRCSSLENMDLLHTNLREIGDEAFAIC
ncbi:hypothetical protein TrLO_g4224 [Triparma laevis f. longispina]|uniref:Uncharacterized protein n=1 Tax=Triparma laevis f. longispina TaxID=1714387 RepID=A0A9W7EK81_9STRA|nr:hypothetical protein TrLO_g4224 [Triparma laevis f. longispina]